MREDWEVEWQDYYEILQINPRADPEVVAGAYGRLAKKHHPDLGGDPAKMVLINKAYAVVHDEARRARYDIAYKQRQAQQQSSAPGVSQQNQQTQPPPNDDDWEDEFGLSDDDKFLGIKWGTVKKGLTFLESLLEPEEPQQGILTGIWHRHPDNLPYRINHLGDDVRVQVIHNNKVIFDGQGKFDGQHLRLAVTYLDERGAVQHGTAIFQLSADQRWLTGPMDLYR